MIEKILERFYNIDPQEMMTEEQRNVLRCCTEIVQEVAKEYGNGWIPVTDRLPNVTECRVTIKYDLEVGGSVYEVKDASFCISNLFGKECTFWDSWHNDITAGVIAWKPKEEPYRLKEED